MDGPLLVIDRDDTRPLGVQLVDGLRRGILAGALRPGDPVPSTRALAAELGVSRSSVVAAYDQLAGEGYLESRQGAPTVVAELEARPADAVPVARGTSTGATGSAAVAAAVAAAAAGDASARGSERGSEREPERPPGAVAADNPTAAGARAGHPIVDLQPGVPSTARLDTRAWRAAWRHAAVAEPVAPVAPPGFGLPELREQLADHLRRARGIACTAADVVVTAGTGEALALLAAALTGSAVDPATTRRTPRVAVEDPGYPSARRTLERRGIRTVPVRVDRDGLDLAALRATPGPFDAVMVTPSHQYPLGGRLPVADRLALLDWAGEHDAIVIEDDYDSEYRHTGTPLPALASLDTGRGLGRTVLVGSLSKVLTPWLRLGWIVLPDRPALRAAIAGIRRDEHSPVSGVVQAAMAEFIASGALRRHIAASRRAYGHRRRLVAEALGDLPGAPLTALDGGLHAVLELPDEASAHAVVTRLADAGVAVAPLAYYADSAPAVHHGIVIGYAAPTDTGLGEALARIRAEVLRALDTGAGTALG
ncbi:PLP-dependent aminotransferase family protein [Agromyces sp. MMS24-K17]|uniref:MocR-like pyridoxine biosynthesis transcription factor PdxR n=1 Tax=Agromyces sp. MMS24-K17 TaxID=3372850 RepID=UPI00375420B3